MGADINIVLAIHHVKSTLSCAVACRHVYGHQDQGRTTNKKESTNNPREDKEPGTEASGR